MATVRGQDFCKKSKHFHVNCICNTLLGGGGASEDTNPKSHFIFACFSHAYKIRSLYVILLKLSEYNIPVGKQ